MKIERIEIILFAVPLVTPFSMSGGILPNKEGVIVKLFSEGIVGYGEGSALFAPIYLPEYSYESFIVLQRYLAPAIIGRTIDSVESFTHHYNTIRGHNFAKAAIENAYWHLMSQHTGIPVWRLLGGSRTHIEVGEAVGIKSSIEVLLDEVEQLIDTGVQRIKLKSQPGWDILPVRAFRERFGNFPLMIDANSSYTLSDITHLKELDPFNLLMIEQPLGYDDIIDHATLQRELKTPICLDESILSFDDARKAIQLGAARIINIKPGRVGGLLEAKKIHDYCVAQNIGAWCGGMFETTIGRFFTLALSSLPGCSYPADIIPPSRLFKEELVRRPLEVINGEVPVPSSLEDFGIDEDLIAQYTLEKAVFTN